MRQLHLTSAVPSLPHTPWQSSTRLPSGLHMDDNWVNASVSPVQLILNFADIKVLAKNKTQEETTDRLKRLSEGTGSALKCTQYGAA